ncbi:hypothetical protein [Brachyspira hyodysenteriae]|uniref:hypothetical protein n=1 Tax=Brachyspira hyodysenteriae TaxID=159 RepID=UPI00063DAD1E|nr:hypothetical protein [Brachyspira hyodysenteriae]KLI52864.1 hypothetical protein SZ42_03055 [Brachyspira hyodysenteriae]
MKNKHLFIKICVLFLIVFSIVLIILSILGSKKRVGYLSDLSLDIDNTLKLNNLEVIKRDFFINGILDTEGIKNYLLTNNINNNLFYFFKINYYNKFFKNSDIYGVYIDTNEIISENSFIKSVIIDNTGTPFGKLITSSNITDKKIDINYTLKLKFYSFYPIIILLLIILYYYIDFNKLLLKIYNNFLSSKKTTIDDYSDYNLLDNFFINFLKSIIVSSILSIILFILKFNLLKIYSIFLLIFTISFFIFNLVKIKFLDNLFDIVFRKRNAKDITYILLLISILAFLKIVFIMMRYINLKDINIFTFFLEIIFIFVFLIILNKISDNKIFVFFITSLSIVLCVYKKYSIAINDVYHHTSHFTSSFFVHNGIPYKENMYSILGHYAILMEPFFKIFGLNVKTYSILLTIIFAISLISIIISIFILIKNPFYRNIALFLIIFFYFTLNNERPRFTVFRIFFPSIIILYISICNIKKNILILFIGYLITSLAILWNSESGLVCLFSLTLTNIYIYCYEYNFRDKKLYINSLLMIMMSLFSLIISLIIFNLYNVCILGGDLHNIKSLLFPLFSGQVSSIIVYNMDTFSIFIILIFIIPFIFYLSKMFIFNNKIFNEIKYYYPIIICICILALGLNSYTINRYNFSHNAIILPMLVIIVPFILYKLDNFIYNNSIMNKKFYYIKNIILYTFIIMLFFCGYLSIVNFTNFYSNNTSKFLSYLTEKNYEKNGVSEITTEYMNKYGYDGIISFGGPFVYGYANLGWTNSLILPNESDWWNPEFGYTKAVNLFLDKNPDVFLSLGTLENMSYYYYNSNDNNSILFFNNYVSENYTNIKTEYEKYNLYFYKKK